MWKRRSASQMYTQQHIVAFNLWLYWGVSSWQLHLSLYWEKSRPSCICRLVLDSAIFIFGRYVFKPGNAKNNAQWSKQWKKARCNEVHKDVHAYTVHTQVYSVLPDSRSEPNTQALLTPGHSVSLQSVHLRGLTIKKKKEEGMNTLVKSSRCIKHFSQSRLHQSSFTVSIKT